MSELRKANTNLAIAVARNKASDEYLQALWAVYEDKN
jgi:hypothetical protein